MSSAAVTQSASKIWTRRELHVRGVRLSYIERESPTDADAAPILMLHGLVAGGDCFRDLADQLSPTRRIIALDLPGGGFSDRLAEADISFHTIANLVADAIAALGLDRPILLGHSYGGAITLQLAATRPDLLHGMVLIAPAHPFSGYEKLMIRFYLSAAGRRFAHLLPRLPRRVLLEGFRRMPGTPANAGYEQIETYLETLRFPGTVAHLLRLLENWKHDMQKLSELLEGHAITVPALLIWGDRDPVVPATTGTALMRHLPHSEQITLPGVGHLPNLESPQECAELIRTWLIGRETHWKYSNTSHP